jgi:hypothetical protein
MDEIEWKKAYTDATEEVEKGTLRHAMKFILQLIDDLNTRVIELQSYEPDEDE